MEQQEAEAPTFELLARREAPAGGAKRARRSKPAAKTLLPEDHHYQVGAGAGMRCAVLRQAATEHLLHACTQPVWLRCLAAVARLPACSFLPGHMINLLLLPAGGEPQPLRPAAPQRGGGCQRGGRRRRWHGRRRRRGGR